MCWSGIFFNTFWSNVRSFAFLFDLALESRFLRLSLGAFAARVLWCFSDIWVAISFHAMKNGNWLDSSFIFQKLGPFVFKRGKNGEASSFGTGVNPEDWKQKPDYDLGDLCFLDCAQIIKANVGHGCCCVDAALLPSKAYLQYSHYLRHRAPFPSSS